MHYTFANPNRYVKSKPGKNSIELESWGWGYFNIPMTIYWQKGTGMKQSTFETDHMLYFGGTGASRTVTIMMNRDKVNSLLGLTGKEN